MQFKKLNNISKVIHKDQGESYWQPRPANGYSEIKLSPKNIKDLPFSSGIQVIAPDSHIRKHSHPEHCEILFFYEGEGELEIDGKIHPIKPESSAFLGPLTIHKISNIGEQDLKMHWLILPNGLDDFFRKIGRPKTPNSQASENFARPEDVERIERETCFALNIKKP
jgi:mannose-6-phosphate isomerase-like protein (cupin superfamily)